MITYQKKKRKEKNRGLTQFYFNLLILKTTHFHTQLITQFQPFFLLKKKKMWDTLFYLLHSYIVITSEKIEKTEGERM